MLEKLTANKFKFKIIVFFFLLSIVYIVFGLIVAYSSVVISSGDRSFFGHEGLNVPIGLTTFLIGILILTLDAYIVLSTILRKVIPRDAYTDTYHDVLDGIKN